MSYDEFMEKMARNVEEHGRSVLSIFEDPVFAYSVGNAVAGLPELIVFGLSPQDAVHCINAWSDAMVKRGSGFSDGELVDLGARFPCKAVACPGFVRERYTVQAGNFLRRPYDVVQMLLPDKEGRFPGDPLCAEPYAGVPVLRQRLQ